jgi:hypothetical protein
MAVAALSIIDSLGISNFIVDGNCAVSALLLNCCARMVSLVQGSAITAFEWPRCRPVVYVGHQVKYPCVPSPSCDQSVVTAMGQRAAEMTVQAIDAVPVAAVSVRGHCSHSVFDASCPARLLPC